MPTRLLEAREPLYLLSIELGILYVVAFGLLSLKTDNMLSVGMAYTAVLCTFLLAYLLPALGLLSALLGFEDGYHAVMAGARGAAVFVSVAFLLMVVLITSLWSSPQTPYLEHMGLANASVADVFLKSSLSENDWVAKLHAIVALSLLFLILVVQSSFFYAIYGADDRRGVFTVADLFGLFVRCSLLLLCVVMDSTDFFGDGVQVGPQMLPSLAFMTLLVVCDFCDTMLEHEMDRPDSKNYSLRLLVCGIEAIASGVYALLALLVAFHYLVGGLAFLRDFIADTRWTAVNMLFVFFLLLDAGSVFSRVLLNALKQLQHRRIESTEGDIHFQPVKLAFSTHAFESPAFGSSIDLNQVVFKVEADKKSR